MSQIRVVIADDQAMVRAGLRGILDAESTIDVVGEAGNGLEAVHLAAASRPDVVLMDLQMPKLDGVDATSIITRPSAGRPSRIIVLTTIDLDEQAFAALRAGASGFLPKHTSPADLVAAIQLVAAGDALLSPDDTRRLIERFAERTSAPAAVNDRLSALTDSERQIFEELGRGASDHAMARRLDLDRATIATGVGRVLSTLGLRDRAQAVLLAHEAGLLPPRR